MQKHAQTTSQNAAAKRQARLEPIRRWNSFHSRRSVLDGLPLPGHHHHHHHHHHHQAPLSSSVPGKGGGPSLLTTALIRSGSPSRGSSSGSDSGFVASSGGEIPSGALQPPGSLHRRRFSVCFGKRTGGSARRPNECLILEPSEMIVIDYPDVAVGRSTPPRPSVVSSMSLEKGLEGHLPLRPRLYTSDAHLLDQYPPDLPPVHNVLSRHELYTKSNRSSHSSDTSSAYSGSDTMQSVQSSVEADELDFSGLVESVVDSDEEEDLAESIDSLTVRDTVRECLEKDPSDRTEEDIETLLEFTQHLKAFNNMTLAVRRALCSVMVFAVVEKAGTVVMNHNEELDSWSVIINGHVEVEVPPPTEDTATAAPEVHPLHLGDSFGITPTMEKLFHQGVMRTRCDDCQFVCITQTDYYRILHQGEENQRRHTDETGRVVLVTEHRVLDGGNKRGHIVIRGTPERLMAQLVEENSMMDPTYVEDFLLTHRTFAESPIHVAEQLLRWFEEPAFRDRVTRVVLLWVNNHFTDFETDPVMMDFLEKFESGLEREKMQGQLRLLNIACAAKARTRTVTLARPSRDEVLHFSILGGYERGFGIFIAKVEKGSKAEDVGLKRGDQVLEVNGQSFEHVSHARALEVLRGTTHLSITVRSNLLAFKEMLNTPDNSPRPRGRKTSEIARLQVDPKARLSTVEFAGNCNSVATNAVNAEVQQGSPVKDKKEGGGHKGGFMTLGHKTRLRKALMKMNLIPKNIIGESGHNDVCAFPVSAVVTPSAPGGVPSSNNTGSNSVGLSLYHSHSNPDLTSIYYEELRSSGIGSQADFPENVLKVYRSDQTCKYLLVHRETTAREVVMLALQEFGLTDPSSNYSLCEVSVADGGVLIKQKRLLDQLQNLAERIGLSSRYYLKNNQSTEPLVPDELSPELLKESQVHFLQLNAVEIAVQLTLLDFSIFRQIESTEYVDDLFNLSGKYGMPMLSQFSELVNREMFWVVTEVCSEHNLVRRMRIVKQFIKVARQCKECKNFNSMFAIISGLGHGAVSRLRSTWEKLPSKYQKLFNDMQDLMDPSRNMSKYRNLINSEQVQPPIIPFYPVVKKDLTFIHLGNDTKVEGLVNFEKLRMISKEVRALTNMCSAPYDLFTMLELGGQPPSTAMVAMNQMTTGGQQQQQPANQATVKRRKKSAAAPNPKKMFEEAQMVRRVKAYLNNMRVITDEDVLRQMSSECEGGGGGGVAVLAAVQNRRRHPSPTLSTASSASATSAASANSDGRNKHAAVTAGKFGAASPQSVRKILSLSEAKTRIYQPPHPTHPPPGHPSQQRVSPNPSLSPSPSPSSHRRHPPPTTHPTIAHSHSHSHPSYPHHHHPHHVGVGVGVMVGGMVGGGRCGGTGRASHERSHSDTPASLPPPVDLSAESSSVTSLTNLPLRKTHTSGSVTSSDSSSVGSFPPPGNYETDSGHSTHFDSHSNSSGEVGGVATSSCSSPPAQVRRFNPIAAPFPHAVPVLPPIPTHGLSPGLTSASGPNSTNPSGPPKGGQQQSHPLPTKNQRSMDSGLPPAPSRGVSRCPPDYSVAAQMARMQRMGRRANSHEGVTGYYHTDPEEDDDEETQVSAV